VRTENGKLQRPASAAQGVIELAGRFRRAIRRLQKIFRGSFDGTGADPRPTRAQDLSFLRSRHRRSRAISARDIPRMRRSKSSAGVAGQEVLQMRGHWKRLHPRAGATTRRRGPARSTHPQVGSQNLLHPVAHQFRCGEEARRRRSSGRRRKDLRRQSGYYESAWAEKGVSRDPNPLAKGEASPYA